MLIVDDKGIIVLANRTAGEQFGFEPTELHNQPIENLIPDSYRRAHVTPRARYMSQPRHRSMAAGRNLYARRKDGSEFPVDISLHPIELQERQMVLANVLDATDRRRADQEREQRQAMERLGMLGQLAGSVAHELRTPLCVIRNDAYFLKMMADKLGDEGLECINEINGAVAKAERIVSELLDFTRDPQSEQNSVEIGRLIDEAIRTVGIPPTALLRRQVEDEDIRVRVDAEQIERVIINLVRNASQATRETGCIEIRTATEGNMLALEVADDGPGIPKDFIERVFEPLFTTKAKGIGLGLAVSRQYAERNGGTLTARNADAGGAIFRLVLPLAAAPVSEQV
jgi:two-component system sensor kinase FixL